MLLQFLQSSFSFTLTMYIDIRSNHIDGTECMCIMRNDRFLRNFNINSICKEGY
jgi:hypothetical protein